MILGKAVTSDKNFAKCFGNKLHGQILSPGREETRVGRMGYPATPGASQNPPGHNLNGPYSKVSFGNCFYGGGSKGVLEWGSLSALLNARLLSAL